MKTTLIQEICTRMDAYLTEEQMQTDRPERLSTSRPGLA